jgi:hypothetical protein
MDLNGRILWPALPENMSRRQSANWLFSWSQEVSPEPYTLFIYWGVGKPNNLIRPDQMGFRS